MTDDNNDITKLVILAISLSAIALIAYLASKDRSRIAIPRQLHAQQPRELSTIEQKLTQLDTKIDVMSRLYQNSQQLQNQQPQSLSQSISERSVVSMGKSQYPNAITRMKNTNTAAMFGMR